MNLNLYKIKRLFKGNFAKNVLIITGGTAIAQVINTLLSPIITRIYPPEQYGVLTVYASILSISVIIGSLKYEWGIPIADDDDIAINVLSLSVIILFIVTVLITIILIFVGDVFLRLFDGEVLIEFKFIIPLGLFFTGLYNIFTQWSYRKQDYKSISKTKFTQAITQNIVKICCGLMNLGPIGLILGNIFGQSAGITTLSMPLIKKDKGLFTKINIKDIYRCAKRYIKFPIYSAPGQFLNITGLQLPVLFITLLYGNTIVGLYGLANSIVSIPMNLIGNSIADVFYGEAAAIGKSDPRRLKDLSFNLLRRSALIGATPLIVLLLFGPLLFSFIFGEIWREAGIFARIISFLVFTRLIFTPITRIFSVYEKQKESLVLDGLRALLVLIVFCVSKLLLLNSYWSIALYAIAMSFVYLLTYLYAHKVLNAEISRMDNLVN